MKIALETDETSNAGVVVPLDGEKTQLDKAQKLPAVAEGSVLVVVTGVTTKKTDAPFTVHIAPDEGGASSSSSGSASGGGGGGGDDGGCACSTQKSHANGALAWFVAVMIIVARRARARVQSASHA